MRSEGWPLWSTARHRQRQVLASGKILLQIHSHAHRELIKVLRVLFSYTFYLMLWKVALSFTDLFSRALNSTSDFKQPLQRLERRKGSEKGRGGAVPRKSEGGTWVISEVIHPRLSAPSQLPTSLLSICTSQLVLCLEDVSCRQNNLIHTGMAQSVLRISQAQEPVKQP